MYKPGLRPGTVFVLLGLCALLHPERAEAQTTCTTRTECVDRNLPFTDRAPVVAIQGPPDTVTTARHPIAFTFSDDFALAPASVAYSGATFTAAPVWAWNKQATSAFSTGEVNLAPGANLVTVQVCDVGGRCTVSTVPVFYKAPPVPRAGPVINTSVHRVDSRNLATCAGCSETVMTYSLPSYPGAERTNTVTLFYSTHQADPRGFVDVEVVDAGTDPAAYMTLQVRDAAGAFMPLNNGTTVQHYTGGAGATRVAASWPAAHLATGMYDYTVIVRSYWSNGEEREAQAVVQVPIVNERNSLFGAGVTIVGHERIHPRADGALITDGAGGIQWFAKTSCDANNICSYKSPPGDQSRLVNQNGYWDRFYHDGSFAEYWGTGNIIFRQDRFHWRTTYHYDGSLVRLEGISDVVGLRTNLAYVPGGKLQTLTDPFGRMARLEYTNGDWARVFGPDGTRMLAMSYDADHRLTGWTDARGGLTSVSYDPASRKMSRVEGPALSDGVTTARATALVRSREASLLPLAGTGTEAAPARRVTADSVWTATTDPSGSVTRISTDPFGLATRIESPIDTVRIGRNTRGQVRTVTDGKGNGTTYEYAQSYPFRVTGVTTYGPDGGESYDLNYGDRGSVKRLRLYPNGLSAAVTYDFDLDTLGRATATKRDGVVVATATYDGPRVTSRSDAAGHTVTYTFGGGPTNNLRTVTQDGVTTEYRYDTMGRPVRTVTAGVPSDSVVYDLLNRVTYGRDRAGGVTRTSFAGNGVDLGELIDPLNQRYQWVRNTLGMVTQEIDPAGLATGYTYHPSTGLLKTLTNRRGQAVGFTYDAEGQVKTRTADGATTTWSYDPDRRWTAVETPASRDTARYDSEGKLSESVTWRDGRRYSIRRTYTERNQTDSVIVAGPWGIRAYVYTHDQFGRFNALRDYAGKWTRLYPNAEGMLDSVRLPTTAGMRLSFSTTSRHQLQSVQGPTALSHEYRYDNRGLLKVDSTHNVNYPLRWSTYDYDALDRVSTWEHYVHVSRPCIGHDCVPVQNDSLAQQSTFSWDSVGNPRGALLSAGNRLRTYLGYSMNYDADGNLIRKYNASGFDQTFTWNALGQLTGVSRTGAATVAYAYDGFGRRVKRTESGTGAMVHYIYDGDDLALEVDGAGNLLREYTYYPGIDQPHGMRQWANGAVGVMYYYVLQQPGHVQALVNAGDTLVNQYRYTPFGMPMNGSPALGTPNPLRYMARELDEGTGMYYVRNRWYDPQVGRFVSEDPIGLAGGINPYAYVGNDPLSFRDPLGLCVTFGKATIGQIIAIYMGWDSYCPVVLDPLVVTAKPVGPEGAGGYTVTNTWGTNSAAVPGGGRRPRWSNKGVPASCPAIFHNLDVLKAVNDTWNRTSGQEAGTFLIPAAGGYSAVPEPSGGVASMPNNPVPPGATINVHSHPNTGSGWLQPLSPADTMWGIGVGIDTVMSVARDTLSVWSPGAGVQSCSRN